MKSMPFNAAAELNGSSRLMRRSGMNPTSTVVNSAEKNFKSTNCCLTQGALKTKRGVFQSLSLVEIEASRGTRMKNVTGRIEVRIALIGAKRLENNDEAITMKKIGYSASVSRTSRAIALTKEGGPTSHPPRGNTMRSQTETTVCHRRAIFPNL